MSVKPVIRTCEDCKDKFEQEIPGQQFCEPCANKFNDDDAYEDMGSTASAVIDHGEKLK